MVGTEEHSVIAFAHLLIEIVEEICEVLVQAEVSVFYLYGVRSYLMTDDIGAGTTHGKEVGLIPTAKVLACDRRLCHLQGVAVAERSAAEDVVTIFLV